MAYEREVGHPRMGKVPKRTHAAHKGACHEKGLSVHRTGDAVFQHDGDRAQGGGRTVQSRTAQPHAVFHRRPCPRPVRPADAAETRRTSGRRQPPEARRARLSGHRRQHDAVPARRGAYQRLGRRRAVQLQPGVRPAVRGAYPAYPHPPSARHRARSGMPRHPRADQSAEHVRRHGGDCVHSAVHGDVRPLRRARHPAVRPVFRRGRDLRQLPVRQSGNGGHGGVQPSGIGGRAFGGAGAGPFRQHPSVFGIHPVQRPDDAVHLHRRDRRGIRLLFHGDGGHIPDNGLAGLFLQARAGPVFVWFSPGTHPPSPW